MSKFMQASAGIALIALVYAFSLLEVEVNLKILLIGLLLVSANAIIFATQSISGSMSRAAMLFNLSIIAIMTASLTLNYVMRLDFRLLHFVGLWFILLFSAHVLYARYVG